MQASATRHSSRISTESTASFGSGSGVLAGVTGTGGVSGGSICDESGNAATTIDSCLSAAAIVPVAVPATDSAAVATSALATAALPIAGTSGASANWASAVRGGARRCSTGATPVFSMPVEPKPASEATTQLARTAVPQNAAATVAIRRGFIIPSSPKGPPEPCCTAKHQTALILRVKV